MTMRIALLVGTLVLDGGLVGAGTMQSRADEPIVHVGLFETRANSRATAAQTGEAAGADITGTVYLAPCAVVGAADPGHAISASATEVWRLSGRVLDRTTDQASVQVDWQRVRSGGQEYASTPQSLTLILKRGERTTLEQIRIPAAGSCEARDVSLDVVFASRRELSGVSVATAAARGGGVRVLTDSRGGATETAVAVSGRASATMMSADLWLVHAAPGRPDETLHLTSPVTSLPRPFSFAPRTIQTPTGALTVRVTGTIETGRTPDGQRVFHFSANRALTLASSTRPTLDPSAPVVEGSTKTTVPLPSSDEVLSFEMPPLQVPGGGTLPDRLSIRVRLTSMPMQPAKNPQ